MQGDFIALLYLEFCKFLNFPNSFIIKRGGLKKIVTILLALVILFLSIGILKDIFITVYVERAVRVSTGLSLKISGLRTAILKGRVDIKSLKLFNPRQFQDRVMLDLGHIYMDYDLGAFLKRTVHLQELDIDLKEFMVVKNKKGDLNLNSLKIVKHNKKPDDKREVSKDGVFHLKIDTLHLKIGKVIYKDYTHSKHPRTKLYNINMDEKFTDIEDIHNLISLVMLKALHKTDIGLLAGFNLALLRTGVVGKSIVTAEKVTNSAYQGIKKLIRLPFEAMESKEKGKNNVQRED